MLESLFIYGELPPNVEKGDYQLPLVFLSYSVAVFASYVALSLAYYLTGAKGAVEKRALHWGGAFALGAGIWSMHFVGMLSYKMLMAIEYDPGLTLLSMLIAVIVAYGVLEIVARNRLTLPQIALGGVLLGIGICGMHYTGMAAMEMDADLLYIPGIFFLSIVIAAVASGAALWIAFTLARHNSKYRFLFQIGAALVMGAGICGMHYTGMAAAVFIPYADCRYDPNQNFDVLALSVAGITSAILGLALAGGFYRKTQTELLLASTEGRLRSVIDNALDAVIVINTQGIITDWNRQAEATFGWSYQEAVGQLLADTIIPPKYREAHAIGMKRFLQDGTGPILNKRIEITALNRQGKVFPVELTVTAQKLENAHCFTAFIRDISARKIAEAELLRYTRALELSNKELDDFAYIASHDLKEPLRGVHNHSKFLLEDNEGKLDENSINRLNRLIYLTQRMEKLINDLLYFSRLGRQDMAIQPTDLNEVMHDIEVTLEHMLEERHGSIIIPHPLPTLTCDEVRITEVFRNLITNALKYNDNEEKIVEVGFLEEYPTPEGAVAKNVIYVKDNGVGVAPEFKTEIFRIFRRLHSTKGAEDGTGVGLTFVKKIIERHGGTIWVESEPGKGSTFYFTLGATAA